MPVSCLLWNCDGINSKQQELAVYLQRMQISIACLVESRLGQNSKLNFQNYNVEEKRRNNAHGGVAILIRRDIAYQRIRDHPALNGIEAVAIRLSDNTVLVTYYNSPQTKLQKKQLDALFGVSRKVIVVGDFNATHTYWGCHRNNVNGNMLNGYVQNSDIMLLHTQDPTHIPDNGTTPSTVDLILSRNVASIGSLTTDTLPSDHVGILFTINDVTQKQSRRCYQDYSKANWGLFRQLLSQRDVVYKIDDITDLESITAKFTSSIKDAIEKSIPKKTIDPTKYGELPTSVMDLIRERDRTRRRYQATRDPRLMQTVKQLRTRIRTKISEHKNETFAKRLSELNVKDGSVWRLNKYLRRKYHNVSSLISEDGAMLTNDEDMAEDFATTFEKYHQMPATDAETVEDVEEQLAEFFLNAPINPADSLGYTTTPKAVKRHIAASPSTKAPGIDGIQNLVLKNLPRKSVVQLTHIINAMIRLQHFPQLWKKAQVSPVPKLGKDLTRSAGYRPISLLPTMSKIAERVLLEHINDHLETNNILPDHQFGFRTAHSAVHQVSRVVNDTIAAFNNRQHTALMLVDLEKAFDRVWFDGLLYKMAKLKFPALIVRLIKSYQTNRRYMVKTNAGVSTERTVLAGVPQGSVLGPVLFNIYTHDIPSFPNTKLATYADDMAIYSHSFSPIAALQKIRNHLPSYEKYLQKWRLTANPLKSTVSVFTRKTQPLWIPSTPVFQQHSLPLTGTTKYLGCLLDTRLRFKPFVECNVSKTMAVLRKLQYVLLSRSTSKEVKLLLFKIVLRPILIYGAPVWSMCAKYLIRKLQVAQNKCLRIILGARRRTRIRTLHEVADVECISEYVRKIANNFFEKTETSDNSLVKNITRVRNSEGTHRLLHQHLDIFKRGVSW